MDLSKRVHENLIWLQGGSFWERRGTGEHYQIAGPARHTETGALMIAYRREGRPELYVQPVEAFLDAFEFYT